VSRRRPATLLVGDRCSSEDELPPPNGGEPARRDGSPVRTLHGNNPGGRRPPPHRPPQRGWPHRSPGISRMLLLLLLLTAALAGCGGQSGAGAGATRTSPPVVGLDGALGAFDRARAALLASGDAVTRAAAALDDADAACAQGDRSGARAPRTRARAAVRPARTATTRLPAQVAAYRTAVDRLSAAAGGVRGLAEGQRQALADVVTAGRAEAQAYDAVAAATRRGWPSYSALDRAESTWLERSTAGWYRDRQEAANAYAVLVTDRRAALETARAGLQRADAERGPALQRVRTAVGAADSALGLTPKR